MRGAPSLSVDAPSALAKTTCQKEQLWQMDGGILGKTARRFSRAVRRASAPRLTAELALSSLRSGGSRVDVEFVLRLTVKLVLSPLCAGLALSPVSVGGS